MADTPTFYLFHGNDDMAIEAAVKKLRASMGDDANADMNINDYQGEEVTVAKVLNDVKSFPFLADKRLVIVKGFVAFLMRTNHGKQQLDTLIEAIPNLPVHARLVLVEREKLRSNLKIVTAAQKQGFCREYSVPKDATGWILNRAETEYDAKIEPQAAAALASVIGTDLRAADNELVKLITYVDGERAVTEKDVAMLTAYVADANVFDMVDALATGNGTVALSLLTQSLEQDPTDPGFRLFSLIARQFRLLLLAREHLDNGGSSNNNAIAKVLGIHPYPAGKVATQSRRFTVPQLEKIYRRVQQYDVEMKTGRIKPRLALELLVASLSKG
ncbi:MAG: DNA polymerase III subunit delta [Anaerolineae bacterium]|nr:DNA polymerase III subunit delta [Anaerolineae bacterium]MDQ7034499.1 DNA polymerase III subunit delta [Anaerolineae bacterium]